MISVFPRFHSQSGQSLIEVTFATAVVSLVLVTLLSSVISSVQNSRVALEQTRSTQLANETLEWFRGQRDGQGWGPFHSALDARGPQLMYCLPALPADFATLMSTSQLAVCSDAQVITGTNFKRRVEVTVVSDTQVRVVSEVSRPGKSGTITTTLETILTHWE